MVLTRATCSPETVFGLSLTWIRTEEKCIEAIEVFGRADHPAFQRDIMQNFRQRDFCCKYGISDPTFYTWRKKYGSMEVSEAK